MQIEELIAETFQDARDLLEEVRTLDAEKQWYHKAVIDAQERQLMRELYSKCNAHAGIEQCTVADGITAIVISGDTVLPPFARATFYALRDLKRQIELYEPPRWMSWELPS